MMRLTVMSLKLILIQDLFLTVQKIKVTKHFPFLIFCKTL